MRYRPQTNLTCGLDPTISDEEFETCHQPCWKIAAPCRHRCRQWYPGVIRRCSAPSAPPNRLCRGWRRRFENWGITRCSEPTLIDCVLDLLMMKRARWEMKAFTELSTVCNLKISNKLYYPDLYIHNSEKNLKEKNLM